jgi:(2Fe-2S) ferredoxin
MEPKSWRFIVCINKRPSLSQPSCASRGGVSLALALETEIAAQGLAVAVERVRCLGECAKGPNLRLAPGGKFFHAVKLDQISDIIEDARREIAACDRGHCSKPDGVGI